MHTYRKTDDGWTVGYLQGGIFIHLRTFDSELSAICFVNVMNGGDGDVVDVFVALSKKIVA